MGLENKLKTQKELKAIINNLKRQGKTIAFTNGCFDILHYGHVKYLEDARAKADILVVGVNSDSSVRKIKGDGRPVNKQVDRLRVLAGLESVDYVTLFYEETPVRLIQLLRPNILVKGGDWNKGSIVGSDFVTGYGGKVRVIPYVKGYSTTNLIKKLNAQR